MPQCKSEHLYDGEIYYCVKTEGHDGPCENDTVPDGTETLWHPDDDWSRRHRDDEWVEPRSTPDEDTS